MEPWNAVISLIYSPLRHARESKQLQNINITLATACPEFVEGQRGKGLMERELNERESG